MMMLTTLIFANTIGAGVAMWFCLCALSRMSPYSSEVIRWAYILKGMGLFIQFLATIDFLYGTPMAWPWLLLTGVLTANAGTGVLYLFHNKGRNYLKDSV